VTADLNALLPFILIGLVVLVLAVWLLARSGRKARVVKDDGAPAIGRDVLEEGAERARRNQALIDAPRGIETMQGTTSAAANSQPVAAAPLGTDAEAGPEVTPEPAAPTPAPAPAPAPDARDDLTRIKGIGPKLVALLGDLGVTTFAQIASWSDEDIQRVDAQLGRFSGRITRDQWIAQARLLAAGDEAGFTERFGKNG
jgi:predicted flap endonuclease-1-like 5' DNA nuclease